MKTLVQTNSVHHKLILLASVTLLVVAMPIAVDAQDASKKDRPHTNHTSGKSSAGNQSLAAQLRELQTKMAKLETSLKQKHSGKMSSGMQGMTGKGIGSMGGQAMGSKRMMSEKKAMMAGQAMGSKRMSGMAMMGQMKGMGKMQMLSALPGFVGASHIYHIGATSFFLDHPQHITLTQQQQTKLNQIKERILLGQATFDRWVSQAEQELWVLTSSDAPIAAKIQSKIREIEKLRSDKRIAYIRAVGQAAGVLTDEQRRTLVGNLPPGHNVTGVGDQN